MMRRSTLIGSFVAAMAAAIFAQSETAAHDWKAQAGRVEINVLKLI